MHLAVRQDKGLSIANCKGFKELQAELTGSFLTKDADL